MSTFFEEPVAALDELGLDAADAVSAAGILLPRGGVALVNSHMKVGRRRLALAHELGHYLIADAYTIDWRVGDQSDHAVRWAYVGG